MKDKQKYYTVTRIVKETYEVLATSREQAKELAATFGDPNLITVVKETVKPSKYK